MRERRRLRLTMEVTPYLSSYSTMFELKHSQIIVDDSVLTPIYKKI